ncbi:MAG: C39 family peptidase [bacterium]|nr:C39 family peptidase [bacterium]
MRKFNFFSFLFLSLAGAVAVIFVVALPDRVDLAPPSSPEVVQKSSKSLKSAPPPPPKESPLPKTKILPITYHTFQTFNNCAPAALSIALSYYGIFKSQEVLAADLRPNNNPRGINDEKSTTPDRLGAKAQEYGLTPYFRGNGNINLIKRLVASGFPVLMRTLLEADEDFAHYRVIKGYDDTTEEIVQDDSYQGKNIRYSYDEFLKLWKPFGYEYLVLVPENKIAIIDAILGEEANAKISWHNAIRTAESELAQNSGDILARFNLSVALYYAGRYVEATKEFEKVEYVLPRLTMWYQIEPIRAYAALGNAGRVFELSDKILNDKNPAFPELYLLRGEMHVAEGNLAAAKAEFQKAVLYNKNLEAAHEALASVSGN